MLFSDKTLMTAGLALAFFAAVLSLTAGIMLGYSLHNVLLTCKL